jgi:hypothetical protein
MPILIALLVVLMCVLFSKLTFILLPLALICGVAVVVGGLKRRCA